MFGLSNRVARRISAIHRKVSPAGRRSSPSTSSSRVGSFSAISAKLAKARLEVKAARSRRA